ncbi:MAG TPA: hypothetical protein DDW52_20285 [Planctomycetaceae bacterium]|nr:hypothetical protein [Planctomycetaceae bacterium]
MNLEEELRTLVRLFNNAKVSYALCGGMAVAIHGFPRFTKDIDFLVDAESLDCAKELAKTAGFVDEASRITFSDSYLHRVLKVEGARYSIVDFLVPKQPDMQAWQRRQWFDWDGLPICVVSVEGLVAMKRSAARDIDLIDIKNLGFDTNE